MRIRKIKKIYYSANQEFIHSRISDKNFAKLSKATWDSAFKYSLWKLKKMKSKPIGSVLKFDLWDEISTKRKTLRNIDYYIHNLIKPNKVFYIEIVPEFCKKFNKSKMKSEHVINGDLTKMPFKEESFDIVIDYSTTDHLGNSQLNSILKNIRHCIKKDGIYLMYHLNKDYINPSDEEQLFPSFPRSMEEILKFLAKNNFKILDKGFFYPFFADETISVSQNIKNSRIIKKVIPKKIFYRFMNSKKFNMFFYTLAKPV